MSQYSTKSILLSSLLLMPSAAFAQQKPAPAAETQTETSNVVVEVEEVEEVVVEEATDDAVPAKDDATRISVIVGQDGSKPVELKIDGNSKHEIRVIEIDGKDMPSELGAIMKRLNSLKGDLKDKTGKPVALYFSIGADGKQKNASKHLDKTMQKALGSLDVLVDEIDSKDIEQQIFRMFQADAVAGDQQGQPQDEMLDLKELTDKLADIKGTISISTSSTSSSTSKDGQKPNVVTNSQIRIIGPDGNVHEMNINGTPLDKDAIDKAVQEALKKAGRDVPEEVKARVDEALKRARDRAVNVVGPIRLENFHQADSAKGAAAKAKKNHEQRMAEHQKRIAEMQKQTAQQSGNSVEQKLDLIMKKLDRMQQEIDELKQK